MPLVVRDRVKETTTTTGTGSYLLSGAVAGFQSFSVIGNGNTTFYAVAGNGEWEVGVGTYSTTGPTLARTVILESSNAGNAVNWGAGTKDIFCTYPAERSLYIDGSTITPAISATLPVASGGTGASNATSARTNLGASTLGSNLFINSTGSGSATFPRFNGDQSVSYLDATTFRTAIGAGTGSGTVTSVGGTGSVNGITLSGSVSSSGNLTLGGSLSNVSLTSQVTGVLPVLNGGLGSPPTAGNIIISNGTSWVTQESYARYFSFGTGTGGGLTLLVNPPLNSLGTRTIYKAVLDLRTTGSLTMLFRNSGGTNITSGYQWTLTRRISTTSTLSNLSSNAATSVPLTDSIAASAGYIGGEINFWDNSAQGLGATGTRMFSGQILFNTVSGSTVNATYAVEIFGSLSDSTTSLGAILFSSTTSFLGTVKIYVIGPL